MIDPNDFVNHLVKLILPFLPVLFGAVEFIKRKSGLSDSVVEWLSVGIFTVYGVLAIVAYFYPTWGPYILGGAVFLIMCAIAPSGIYKFINARAPRLDLDR